MNVSRENCGDHAAQHGVSATRCPMNETLRAKEVETIVGYERADGTFGRMWVGATDSAVAYGEAVRTAVAEARRDGGRHIVVKIIEQPGGRIVSALYAREGTL